MTKKSTGETLRRTDNKLCVLREQKAALDAQVRDAEKEMLFTSDPVLRQLKTEQLRAQLTELTRLTTLINKKEAARNTLETTNNRDRMTMAIVLGAIFVLYLCLGVANLLNF